MNGSAAAPSVSVGASTRVTRDPSPHPPTQEALARCTHVQLRRVANDPIQLVRRLTARRTRGGGFCAAALAFDESESAAVIERVFAVMGRSPAAYVRAFDPARQARDLDPIVHRWTKGEDLTALVIILQRMLQKGSIEAFFAQGYDPQAADLSSALESFSTRAMQTDLRPALLSKPRRAWGFFFPPLVRRRCSGNLFAVDGPQHAWISESGKASQPPAVVPSTPTLSRRTSCD